MRSKHFFFCLRVVVALTIFITGQAFAGGGGMEGLPEGALVTGPEFWATIVLTCTNNGTEIGLVSLRAKKIEDCNVETEAKMFDLGDRALFPLPWECPSSANDIVNNFIPDLYIFGDIHPVITKVKNFVNDIDVSGTISFDAQIKYYKQ